MGRAVFLPKARGENPLSCVSQLLEAPALLGAWLLPARSKPVTAGRVLTSHHPDSLLPPSSTFKDPYDYTGPTQVIQDNLFKSQLISKVKSVFNSNSPLPCDLAHPQYWGLECAHLWGGGSTADHSIFARCSHCIDEETGLQVAKWPKTTQ